MLDQRHPVVDQVEVFINALNCEFSMSQTAEWIGVATASRADSRWDRSAGVKIDNSLRTLHRPDDIPTSSPERVLLFTDGPRVPDVMPIRDTHPGPPTGRATRSGTALPERTRTTEFR